MELHGCDDRALPMAGLIVDPAGNLYGTTNGGGNPDCLGSSAGGEYPGCGVVYKLTPAAGGGWNLTTLWQFSGPPSDGANPRAGLVVDQAGTLYGTTQLGTVLRATSADAGAEGGANPCAGDSVTPGCGTASTSVAASEDCR
jgi:hypothetical protein